ncbi:Chaperone protein dnaJ 11 [Nymphaea thermarum]|nr:Chaperone protein dnaJ 11 [Nymphaea thermarum]
MLAGSSHAVASFSWPVSRKNSSRSRQTVPAASCSATVPQTSARLNPAASLYDVLGLSCKASADDIKAAYRRLARTYHPDVVASDDKNESTSHFMAIHCAYSTLSDPEQRAEYDRKLSAKRPSFHTSIYGGSRRTWETDQCW